MQAALLAVVLMSFGPGPYILKHLLVTTLNPKALHAQCPTALDLKT